MGMERVAMLKYGVDDIRNFYANDLRFLRSFDRNGLSRTAWRLSDYVTITLRGLARRLTIAGRGSRVIVRRVGRYPRRHRVRSGRTRRTAGSYCRCWGRVTPSFAAR
jgi:hypothetical protein